MRNIVYLLLLFSLFIQCTNKNSEETMEETEECCSKESRISNSRVTEITCPECDYTKTEILPTDVCVINYTCENCKIQLTPIGDDCCVYCSYGTHKCPSKQE